ncbi:MAG: hypothetical protein M3Q46_05260, partial [Verrucomicrobiota bacterium]|nr:hypothetical protein [Verrucomicrobiota bacterium]
DHIGDLLYNSASLEVLARGLPQCEWHYLANSPGADALVNNPSIKSCVSSLAALGPVDVALCYNSGGYWRDLARVTRAGTPNRVGYTHKGFSALVTHPIQIRHPQPFPAYFRDLVAQLTEREPDWSLRPQVFSMPADEERADELWQELKLDNSQPVLACFVTSRQLSGVLPVDRYAAAIAHIEKHSSAQTILLGAPFDGPLLGETKNRFNLRAQVAAGKLGLLPLVSFLRRCSAVFCTDSGPRHLANAAGVPPIYYRNISFSKVEAGSYCEGEVDLAPDLEFVRAGVQKKIFDQVDTAQMAERVLAVLANQRT